VIRCDAIIVGGGPAGSTCARELRKAGWNVVVVDRAQFPRDKVCAGWLTPEVFPLLELDPVEYRNAGLTLQGISAFRTGVIGRPLIETRYGRTVSYAVRRCEFDDFLLRRARVRVIDKTSVDALRRERGTWIVNDMISAPVIVGAGGHFCPVARHLRGGADSIAPVVAKEAEFRIDGRAQAPDAPPELFFCRDLEGYAWYVPKGDYVNVGIGRRGNRGFSGHLQAFMTFLERTRGLSSVGAARWRGHAYLASGAGHRPLIGDGVLLAGDAAGLAYPESGEGIRPAIESGLLAARTLVNAHGHFRTEDLRGWTDCLRRLHPRASAWPSAARPLTAAFGRLLLGSPVFTRHVVLDRWFLRA
jgi:geranylgeranyl reductase family protein